MATKGRPYSPVLLIPAERQRFIAEMRGRSDLSPSQARLLAWAMARENAYQLSLKYRETAQAAPPLAPTGSGVGSWVRGFNTLAAAWTPPPALTPAQRRRYRPRVAPGEMIVGRRWSGLPGENAKGYRGVKIGDTGLTPAQLEAFFGRADAAFRGVVAASMDRRGADLAYTSWRLWPVATGLSKRALTLGWHEAAGSLTLRFRSGAEYTLVAQPTAKAWGAARSGLRAALALVASDINAARGEVA